MYLSLEERFPGTTATATEAKYYSLAEAARVVSVTYSKIYDDLKRGYIKSYREPSQRAHRILHDEVVAWYAIRPDFRKVRRTDFESSIGFGVVHTAVPDASEPDVPGPVVDVVLTSKTDRYMMALMIAIMMSETVVYTYGASIITALTSFAVAANSYIQLIQ
jgi:hypothetical protein